MITQICSSARVVRGKGITLDDSHVHPHVCDSFSSFIDKDGIILDFRSIIFEIKLLLSYASGLGSYAGRVCFAYSQILGLVGSKGKGRFYVPLYFKEKGVLFFLHHPY